MAEQFATSEVVTQDLKELIVSEKEGQKSVAVEETEGLRNEILLQPGRDHCASDDPVQKIMMGLNKYPDCFEKLAQGQQPKLRYSGVGAIIEYAVGVLKVENILVIGHSRCGGIERLVSHPEDGSAPFDFIDDWIQIALPAKAKVKAEHSNLPFEEQCKICAEEAINLSLVNLQTHRSVQRAIAAQKLASGVHTMILCGIFETLTMIVDPIITQA